MTISDDDGFLSLMDLPTEVIELGFFPYLTHKELNRMRLNRRLRDIADSVIEKGDKKCKYELPCLMNDKYTQTFCCNLVSS